MCSPAQYQINRTDDNRLAGPCLSGKDVETGFELNIKAADDGEIGDCQMDQHFLTYG
jgi:hypothetical protein